MSPQDESLLFQEIPSVFSASKYEQKVTEAPSSVSIVTADEIRKYGYQTLAEILASMPGVFATDDRNYDYLGVRGFGIAGDYNTRVRTDDLTLRFEALTHHLQTPRDGDEGGPGAPRKLGPEG